MKSIVYSQDRACIAQAMGRLLGDADTTHCEFRIVRGEEHAWMQMTVRVTERCEDGLTAEAGFLGYLADQARRAGAVPAKLLFGAAERITLFWNDRQGSRT